MGTGWMTWACLLLATGAPEPLTYHMNSRGFQIPFSVDPMAKNTISEFIVYRSNDMGRTWQTYARVAPDKGGFDFLATEDGVYCFSIAVVDRQGIQQPADVYKAPIGMKVVVDTTKPFVRLTTERLRDEVVVHFEARDEWPDWSTMKIEYKAAGAANWTPVPITAPGERGKASFRPGMAGEITVRLSLADQATNVGMDERVVSGLVTVSNLGTSGAGGTAHLPGTLPGTVPGTTPGTNPGANPLPGELPGVPGSAGQVASLPSNPNPGVSPPLPDAPPPPRTNDTGVVARSAINNRNINGSGTPLVPEAGTGTRGAVVVPRGALPEVQIVNKRQVTLGFDIPKVGPSGLKSVSVYVTTDEGNTWNTMPVEGGLNLPNAAELRVNQPVTGSVKVNLPSDGVIYGLIVVAQSNAGLSRPVPVAGDVPQVRLELDTTPPVATMYVPTADPSNRDQMIFTWKAEDRNLATNPITLEWAERPAGPWQIIGEPQLPNEGKYAWKVPERIPPNVFLRMTVRDRAGNASHAVTPKPIPLDTHVPEVVDVRVLQK